MADETTDTDQPDVAEPETDVESATAEPDLMLGEAAPAETPAPRVAPVIRGKIDKSGVAIGTGRRKTAVARVRIKDGNGMLKVNGRELDDYFQMERDRQDVTAPLRATNSLGNVDVWVRVCGGGTTGQAGAIVLGIARALQARNPALHGELSDGGYLTRDSRMVERKKYGYKKARKSFQFSKR
ncbi:MAG: 30S ribosomal protein S9 [Planctomycetaceae bacterium]